MKYKHTVVTYDNLEHKDLDAAVVHLDNLRWQVITGLAHKITGMNKVSYTGLVLLFDGELDRAAETLTKIREDRYLTEEKE